MELAPVHRLSEIFWTKMEKRMFFLLIINTIFFCHLQYNSDFCYIILQLQSTGENSPGPFPSEHCVFVYVCTTLQLRAFHYNWTEFSWPISFSTWEFWKLFCCFKTCSVLLSVSTVKLWTICILCYCCLLLFSIRRTLETALSKKV